MTDLPEVGFGHCAMSYWWLSYQHYDTDAVKTVAPDWQRKVSKRNVRHGDKDGFVIEFTGQLDSPKLQEFCKTHGVELPPQ